MDWDKIKTDTPESLKEISDWMGSRYKTSITGLKFHYLIFMIQEFFAEYSIYVCIERKANCWRIRINNEERGNYNYDKLIQAWEIAFSIAFELLELRYKQKDVTSFTARDLYNSLIDFLPERHKKKFNNFNAALNALRNNKLKGYVFSEHIDWEKKENLVYYNQSGLRKIKQYFVTLKMKQ